MIVQLLLSLPSVISTHTRVVLLLLVFVISGFPISRRTKDLFGSFGGQICQSSVSVLQVGSSV